MLTDIHISNLVTIETLNLDCLSGTTVITGETGAGKSILIDAIELALGARATGDMVRTGQDKADISICFNLQKLQDIISWLKNNDLESQSEECIIRRVINKDGRSRSYINNNPCTLQILRELSEQLINIHGQHEHQALLKSDAQRTMLDRYAGHDDLIKQIIAITQEWQKLTREAEKLRTQSEEKTTRCEFLSFQLQELKALNLQPNEFTALDTEHKKLAHAGELIQHINQALSYLTDQEDNNIQQLLNQALHALEAIKKINPKLETCVESLTTAAIQITDTESELRNFLEAVDLDPERLQQAETRISALFDIARKHKITPDSLYEFQQKLSAEIGELENSDQRLSELTVQLATLEKKYQLFAEKLSISRKKFAKKLETEITQMIHELSLPHGEFHIHLETELSSQPNIHGSEKIIFQIKTNTGHPMQPLAKIASGGELSRISLAIHMATAEQHTIPTLIFDEVDVGIGGGTAEIVGKLLRRLGETHQVICITHLPQVAAQGHHHWQVQKITEKNTTYTHIQPLSINEKINELARMLGGVKVTETTLAHAKEMLAETSSFC